jgi:hydrogenase maturation protease
MERKTAAVVGLGNLLLTDDGIGIWLVRALQKLKPPGELVLYEIGTSVFDLDTPASNHRRLLLVDAMYGGGEPGTIYNLSSEEVKRLRKDLRGRQTLFHSLHDFSVLDLPGYFENYTVNWQVFGVEPAVIDYGTNLSPQLAHLLPILAKSLKYEAVKMASDLTQS